MVGSEEDAEAKHRETGNKGGAAELDEKPGRHNGEGQKSIVHWAHMDKTESGNRVGAIGKIPI